MTPVEAPINNPGLNRTKRQGQPTVNVPSEKMAAFLHEIKTAKLRKVGSGVNAMGGDGVAGPSGLSKSVSITTSSASTGPAKISARELQRRRSLASLRVPIGSSLAAPVQLSTLGTTKGPEAWVRQKRKADTLGVDEATAVPRMSHFRVLDVEFILTRTTWFSEAPYDTVIYGNKPARCDNVIGDIAALQSLTFASPTLDQ